MFTFSFSLFFYTMMILPVIASKARRAQSALRSKRALTVGTWSKNRTINMHSVSLKSNGPVFLVHEITIVSGESEMFPSALDKLNETALRRMVSAVTSLAN